MRSQLPSLLTLTRDQLLAKAREALLREASLVYAPEAMPIVESIFTRAIENMDSEQLAIIASREDAS